MTDRAVPTEQLFERAYQSHWLSVFRFAVSLTNDWHAAEDIAQEAFTRLWERRDHIDWTTAALPWVLTASRHLAVDRFRALKRRLSLLTRGEGSERTHSALEDRLAWLDLQRKMKALPPAQRSALVLTAVLGLSADESAQVLGITPGAVRAAASRARKTLRTK